MVVDEKRRKDDIKQIILVALREWGVIGKGEGLSKMGLSELPVSVSGLELTFQERKELMTLQLELAKLKYEAERIKVELETLSWNTG